MTTPLKKMLILAFEANRALSHQMIFFPHFRSLRIPKQKKTMHLWQYANLKVHYYLAGISGALTPYLLDIWLPFFWVFF